MISRPLANNAPFNHVLRLFIVSSHSHCDFGSVHRASAAILLGMVLDKPLEIDFDEWRLLKKALSAADESDAEELKSSLRKALYYSYTIQSDIVFDEGPSESTKTTESPIANAESNVPLNHISGTEAALCEGLMTNIAEHFSSIIFQPPGALHMECTDVYAALWMERAVQPAISDNGTADPFGTLRRLRLLDWKRETDASGYISEPCEECLKQKRDEWEEEAQTIWKLMDGWLQL